MRFLLSLLILVFVQASFALTRVTIAEIPVFAPRGSLSPLKSFKDWKSEKVQAASAQVEQTRNLVRTIKGRGGRKDPALANLEQRLAQEEWSLEVASDLSVTDYLVLYLAQHGSPTKLTDAASKLSPEEMAQILDAYIRSMGAFPSESRGMLPTHAMQGK